MKVFYLFYKKRLSAAKPPFEILRFFILLFCGSLFRLGEVPQTRGRWQLAVC